MNAIRKHLNLLNLFVAATAAAGLALALTGIAGATEHRLATVLVLTAIAFAAELFAVELFADSHVSVSGAALMAAAAISGAWGIALAAPAIALAGHIRCRRPVEKSAFNAGTFTIAGFAYLAAFQVLGGDVRDVMLPLFLLPVIGAGLVNMAVNSALVATAIGLSQRRTIARVWREDFAWLAPQYVVLAGVAGAMAITATQFGPWALVLVCLPALSLREALRVRVLGMHALRQAAASVSPPRAA